MDTDVWKNVRMKGWLWKMVSQVVVFTELELDQDFTTLEVMDYFKQQYFFFSCLKDFSVSKWHFDLCPYILVPYCKIFI